jgi:hypothetical protein
MTAWPNTLPAAPLLEAFHETPPDTTLRTPMEQGPAKLRQRTTAGARLLTVTYLLSRTQVETLETFYTATLQGGSASFTYTHPRTGTTVSCRFTRPPEYGAVNGSFFKVALTLEILP